MPESSKNFNLLQLPLGQNFQYFIASLSLGIILIMVAFYIPPVDKHASLNNLISKVNEYELQNDLQAGQFRFTTHKGDTKTNLDATFYGISILTSKSSEILKNEAKVKSFVQTFETHEFNKNVYDIYKGIVLMKRLGIYNPKKLTEKYYNLILQLGEPNSGFRIDSLHSASVSATYFAIKTIEELGKLDEFKSTEQYQASLQFIQSLREDTLGGFSDVSGQNATLEATYYAIKILPTDDKTYLTEQFVYACQTQDGSLSNEPIDSLTKYYYTEGDLVSTVRGLIILSHIGLESSMVNPISNAKDFVQYNLDKYVGLEATYYIQDLITNFPSFNFGPSRILQLSLFTVAAFFLIVSLFAFYRQQISDEMISVASGHSANVLFLLILGSLCSYYYPTFSIFPYLALSLYLAIQYYETQLIDTPDGTMVLISCANSLIFMALVASFVYFSPFVYGQGLTFFVLLGWSVFSSFLSSYGGCFFIKKQNLKKNFLVKAGFLSWITNTFLLFMFLHGRGDMTVFYRLVSIRGIYPLIFVGFPFLSLLLTYFASTIGFLVFKSNKP